MSAADAFLDTNVLLYLLSGDAEKAARAEALAVEGGVISVQVLNEFASVALRKFRAPWRVVHDNLAIFRAVFRVEPLTVESHELGLQLAERHRLGVYDAQLLARRLHRRLRNFYSEDMHDGLRVLDRLTVRKPVRADGRLGRTRAPGAL